MTCDLEGSAPFLGQGVDLSRGNKTEKKVESNDAIYFFYGSCKRERERVSFRKKKRKNRERRAKDIRGILLKIF